MGMVSTTASTMVGNPDFLLRILPLPTGNLSCKLYTPKTRAMDLIRSHFHTHEA